MGRNGDLVDLGQGTGTIIMGEAMGGPGVTMAVIMEDLRVPVEVVEETTGTRTRTIAGGHQRTMLRVRRSRSQNRKASLLRMVMVKKARVLRRSCLPYRPQPPEGELGPRKVRSDRRCLFSASYETAAKECLSHLLPPSTRQPLRTMMSRSRNVFLARCKRRSLYDTR